MRAQVFALRSGLLGPLLAGWCGPAAAQPATQPAGSQTIILDTTSFWRMYPVFQGPLVQADGALKPVPDYSNRDKLDWYDGHRKWMRTIVAEPTLPAPADWRQAGFDDSQWVRGTAARACLSPYLARLALRGKFQVSDPAKVKGLSLSVDFHGGAVISVNGREVARAHRPPGAELAEAYPLEAFVSADGNVLHERGQQALRRTKTPADHQARIDGRVRTLTAAIPGGALRAGLNVLAIELVRAPYHKVVDEQPVVLDNHNKSNVPDLSWNTCQILRARLTAEGGEGLVAQPVRPHGFQLWSDNPLALDHDLDCGEAGPLEPIRLVGARNGVYSGKVVLGCDEPIRGLAATSGDLRGEGGTIPAAQVQIRYGMPWGSVVLTNQGNDEAIPYPAEPSPLMALHESPPAEVPVYRKQATTRTLKVPGQPEPVFGAVISVWVTVRVPKAARPGAYAGQVTLSAEGLSPTPVGVSIQVADWTLPDPADNRTWVELVQSPDTLAMEYNLPLWSPRHWDLIGKSMGYLRPVGSRVLYVPLIARSNAGNSESMVRWVAKGDGRYDYDFSVMDRYLDLAQKYMGTPQVVAFNVWDWYLGGTGSRLYMYPKDARGGPSDRKTFPPVVTALDPDTGKTQDLTLLDYTDPNSRALWKPLFDQLKDRMQARGLGKAMMLGMITDNWPYKEQVEFLKDVSGDLPWVNAGHYTRKSLFDGLAGFGYQSSFFGYQFSYLGSLYGWKGKDLVALFERVYLDEYPPARWRSLPEQGIMGNMRGVGRLGADTWLAVKDRNGRRVGRAWERFPGANWGYLNVNSSTLAPAEEGPVATMRYEALREGVQECEARIAIEQALSSPELKAKLAEDLASRCQEALLERQKCFWRSSCSMQSGPLAFHDVLSWRGQAVITGQLWFVGSGWQDRSEKIYTLAGEVSRALAGN